MFTLENRYLKVDIHPKGAELQSIFNKDFQLEYIWGGDPAFWAKRSPILFPIVGSLKNDTYFFNNNSYRLSRHGFAREKEFMAELHLPEFISFLLKSDEDTQKNYPFEFEFRILYTLVESEIKVTYRIKNTSSYDMFFSVGGHPAFRLPLVEKTNYADYYLEFNEDETKPRWPISKDGLIEKEPVPLLSGTNLLPLNKDLFLKDALVLKYPTSSIVSVKSDKTEHGIDLNYSSFPYLGIWAAPHADFICIEPWCGIADAVNTDQQLIHKEGINQLAPEGIFERSWLLTLF